MKSKILLTMVATAVLVACGGGGDAGGFSPLPIGTAPPPDSGAGPTPAPGPAPAPSPAPAPVPITANYKFFSFTQERGDSDSAEKRFDDYVALLNQQGAAGYRYVEGVAGGSIVTFTDNFLMVKDSDASYTYSYQKIKFGINDGVNEIDALLAQMKAQGAKGLQYVKILSAIGLTPSPESRIEYAVLYRKDNSVDTTYDYTAVPRAEQAQDWVAAANVQGANGYRPWAVPYLTVTGDVRQFFIKDMKSASRYQVKTMTGPDDMYSSNVALKAQLDEQGAQGFRLLKVLSLENIIYVKDTTQSSIFNYEFPDPPQDNRWSEAQFVPQANALTANGLRYFSYDRPVYFRSWACTGPLCASPDATERVDGN